MIKSVCRYIAIAVIFAACFSFESAAQNPELDMLEMRFDQGLYRQVYRKANRLLDNPEYDASFLPRYYKAISAMQLYQNERWRKRNKNAFLDARETLLEMQKSKEGRKVLAAHIYELSALKKDLQQWSSDLQIEGNRPVYQVVNQVLLEVFANLPSVDALPDDKAPEVEVAPAPLRPEISARRNDVLREAEKHLGTPYKYSGTSPAGFDCSGFTSYVFEEMTGKKLSRRSVDQYHESKRVKEKNVKPGDLVFFDNGSGISHVGIIYSTDNGSLKMIHSSTSIGISIIDINTSNYWKQRLAGFGTVLED
jgi:cell wall-associated NlpC family hydrolase